MQRRAIAGQTGFAWLLGGHAAVTAAAGAVLVAAPDVIPAAIGIRLPPNADLLCYLLAAAELGFAALSAWGAAQDDARAVRGVVLACVVLHGASAALELLALARGADGRLWCNVGARVAIVGALLRLAPTKRADHSVP